MNKFNRYKCNNHKINKTKKTNKPSKFKEGKDNRI